MAKTGSGGGDAAGDHAGFFRQNGYLVVPGLLAMDEVEELRHEAACICRGQRGEVRGIEPGDPGESDEEVSRRYLCIHFPHKISPLMRETLAHPRIVGVLERIIGPNVKCMQSMQFMKYAGKPGQAWHQDEHYIPTRDRSLTAAWIALDDATIANGCLWIIPGSQKNGIIWPNRPHEDARFDEGWESYGFPYTEDAAVPLEVAAGGVVFFHGYLLHRSFDSTVKSGFRRALVNHYMSAESLLPWDWDGRLEPTRDNRDIVTIRGEDPYAYKGIENLTYPLLRGESAGHPPRDKSKKLY